jgi:GntR family transcriptional regulator / MocR family aminotransferase
MKRVASGLLPLIAIDRKSQKSLHKQIYDAYRLAVVNGHLHPGQRVPSTRVLSSELGVSRFPVLDAYSQLLAEGYFESRVGAGTVVCSSLPERFTLSAPNNKHSVPSQLESRPVARRASTIARAENVSWARGLGAFGLGQVAFDQFPHRVWSKLVSRHCRQMNAESAHYGDHMGLLTLRETIASYLRTARSVRCEAEQVMIVSGSQQALIITAHVLLDPASSVWVEEPGYRLARDAFALNQCNVVPIPVDKEGLNVAAGILRCRKARAAIITPSHQFPFGVTMSAQRRLQLLDWAQNTGAWIIEDDYDSEYRYEISPIASLQGLDLNGRVIYVGTFSKVLFPSLRLGYVVIPPDLVDSFLTVRRALDLGPPNFSQKVLTDFIGEGHFERHIRRMRILYRERRTILVESIEREFGSMVEVLGSHAGMHLTMKLPNEISDIQIAERAARQNLWIWPLSAAFFGQAAFPGFVLGFGSTAAADIPDSVRKLRKLFTKK